jgi:hypothetical protein
MDLILTRNRFLGYLKLKKFGLSVQIIEAYTLVFFWAPTKPLQAYGHRQACNRDTNREMTGRSWSGQVAGGRRGKDDRKQNTLAALVQILQYLALGSYSMPK